MVYFDWDEAKARQNLTKHGITFEDAATIFDDPLCRLYIDRVNEGEERWHAIGIRMECFLFGRAYDHTA